MGKKMNQVRRHAAANAKAMAIFGQLLKRDDYIALLNMDQVDNIIKSLKNKTHYSMIFDDLNNPIEVYERMMKQYFFSCYGKLSYFYFDEYKTFFKSMTVRYEVENLKLYIRAISRQEDPSNLENHLLLSSSYSEIDYLEITKAKNMQELIYSLKGTRFHDPMLPFLYEEPSRMAFHMEMILDRLYFNQLHQSILRLNRGDREAMMDLLGMNIDALNLQWIYRGRRYYDMSSEELFNFTLSDGKKYDLKRLKELCYMDLDAYREIIIADEYGDLFKAQEYMLERAMERYLFYKVEKMIRKAEISISKPVGLLFMFEYEIRDLFTIMEAKKYHFEKVEELLIRDLGRVVNGCEKVRFDGFGV